MDILDTGVKAGRNSYAFQNIALVMDKLTKFGNGQLS